MAEFNEREPLAFTVMPKINSKNISRQPAAAAPTQPTVPPAAQAASAPTRPVNAPVAFLNQQMGAAPPPPPGMQALPQQPSTQLIDGSKQAGGGKFAALNGSALTKILKPILFIVAAFVFAAAGYFGWRWFAGVSEPPPPPPVVAPELPTEPPPELALPPAENPPDPNAEWLLQYFGVERCSDLTVCDMSSDPDRDGLTNSDEKLKETDPNNADSDLDGLADGDEVNIFKSDPLNPKSSGDTEYTDADDAKGGYASFEQGRPLTGSEMEAVGKRIREFGLHQPSVTTLLGFLAKYGAETNDTEPTSGPLDTSPEAKLERDALRASTIKKIGVALYKYFQTTGSFPSGASFPDMLVKIKPFVLIATNASDPINKPPHVYAYVASAGEKDFQLTYYSETQNQLIKYGLAQALRDSSAEAATAMDEKRVLDLENLRQALLIYAASRAAAGEVGSFPPASGLEAALVPTYLQTLPRDPKTGKVYEYQVSQEGDSFALTANLENLANGSAKYICDPEGCVSD